jgi:hypothetical protein
MRSGSSQCLVLVIMIMSPAGELTEFSGMGGDVRGITAGLDGNLWFHPIHVHPTFGRSRLLKPSADHDF